jgi:membrane dipeptidase
MRLKGLAACAGLAVMSAGAGGVGTRNGRAGGQTEADLVTRARAIHERAITLDTHNDIEPANFTASCNYTMRLTTQVNLPKMRDGGLDVSFLIVYVGQPNPQQVRDAFQPSGYERAYKAAIEKFDAVHRLTNEIAPNEIELALTPADVVRIAKSGKKVAVIGVENGYPIGTELASGNSGSGAPGTCRSFTTGTVSSPTRTPANKTTSGPSAACRRSASR